MRTRPVVGRLLVQGLCALLSSVGSSATRGRVETVSGSQVTLSLGAQDGVAAGLTGSVRQAVSAGGKEHNLTIASFRVTRVRDRACTAELNQVGEGFAVHVGDEVVFDRPLVATPTAATARAQPASTAASAAPTAPGTAAAENLFWNSVKDSKDAAELQAYVTRFPKGLYVELAQARLKRLAAERSEESSAWDSIRHSADPAVFRDFLKRFPDGAHAAEARANLAAMDSLRPVAARAPSSPVSAAPRTTSPPTTPSLPPMEPPDPSGPPVLFSEPINLGKLNRPRFVVLQATEVGLALRGVETADIPWSRITAIGTKGLLEKKLLIVSDVRTIEAYCSRLDEKVMRLQELRARFH